MPCFRPLQGFRAALVNPTGKRSIVFSRREALSSDPEHWQSLPCGRCIYCRLEHSRNWAVRCAHEASYFDSNCFITLTYSDDFLPRNGSLDYDAVPIFLRELRRKFGEGIRSFGCAEYGEKLSRPHYHLCLFNFDFFDKKLWKENENEPENNLYTSEALQSLWPYGHSTVGGLTFESAAYVARYVTKKITGAMASAHYESVDERTGEVFERLPERSIGLSRMPGIGRRWIEDNADFVLNNGFVISRGKKVAPPKYYLRYLEKFHSEKFELLKEKRQEMAKLFSEKLIDEDHRAMVRYARKHNAWTHGSSPPTSRLFVEEVVKESSANLLKRSIENV